jgi:hypothetical protein
MTNKTLRCPEGHTNLTQVELWEYDSYGSLFSSHIPYKHLAYECQECKLPYFDYQCTEENEGE